MATNILDPITPEDTLNPPVIEQPPTQEPANAIIASQIPAPADEYKAPETVPVTTQVAPEGETVESRLNTLTATGSKYTDLAKADAQRSANSRGLINSTMAGAAGTEAAIRAGLPIAQQDAQTMTDTRMLNQNTENEFLKNRQSADLNMETAAHTSQLAQLEQELDYELKERFELILQDAKFSDETKMSIVNTMGNIIRDSQTQITEVGLSDRSAAQQAAAITMIETSRDAELAVYETLLGSFEDWDWGTDFTPDSDISDTYTSTLASQEALVRTDKTSPPSGTVVTRRDEDTNTVTYTSSDGDWRWHDGAGEWIPI